MHTTTPMLPFSAQEKHTCVEGLSRGQTNNVLTFQFKSWAHFFQFNFFGTCLLINMMPTKEQNTSILCVRVCVCVCVCVCARAHMCMQCMGPVCSNKAVVPDQCTYVSLASSLSYLKDMKSSSLEKVMTLLLSSLGTGNKYLRILITCAKSTNSGRQREF